MDCRILRDPGAGRLFVPALPGQGAFLKRICGKDTEMIVYGSGGGKSMLGDAGTHECPVCSQTAAFNAVCVYEYWHVYWLFGLVTKRDYYIECSNCLNATSVEKSVIKQQFPKDNIPLFKCFGWMLIPAIIIFFVIVGAGASSGRRSRPSRSAAPAVTAVQQARDAQRLSQGRMSMIGASGRIREALDKPQVGDLYLLNLSYVPGSGFGPDNNNISERQAWGTMRLVEIEEDGSMVFATSTRAWEEKDAVPVHVQENTLEYDMDELVETDLDTLKDLQKKQFILDVRRAKAEPAATAPVTAK